MSLDPPSLVSLFTPEPYPWGLRGDPSLWREMKCEVENIAWPESESALMQILETLFLRLTGASLSQSGPVHVPRYNPSGMSGGYVSPGFWRETAFPVLRARFQSNTN